MAETNQKQIKPQEGFQEDFLKSPADIVIGGGAAGVGKTYALLLEPLRHKQNKNFGAAIFRRTSPQIRMEGGLWDTSVSLYSQLGASPRETTLDWTFPSGSAIGFYHLEYEKDLINYQGAQFAFIGFDELTHFTKKQFFYLLSRNRSTSGVRPYVRATCNPDPDSWVANFIEWWIDQDSGFPIPERAGKIRYFTRDGEATVWGNSEQEVIDKCPHLFTGELETVRPKSATFIPGSIYDNKELLSVDPGYLANLMAQDESTKAALLHGNWKIKLDGLELYNPFSINDIFTNVHVKPGKKYITIDAARFGSDKAVIKVWNGFRVIDIAVYLLSSTTDIANKTKEFERQYAVPRSSVVCDADGVGGGVVDQLPGCHSFNNGASPIPIKGKDENYYNLKTQCFYHSADRVNNAEVYIEPQVASKIVDGKTVKVLLSEELRAIKKDKVDMDGKRRIIPKEQTKNILGRSPDFAECFMMREYFEVNALVPTTRGGRF